jgi:rod shape-determining protein MreD
MNKSIYFTFLFISLVLFQVFVLDNIVLFGYVNPYLYIAFIFFYPLKENRFYFLFLAFLLGLSVDFFSDSGGIHAFSTLFIAYLRLILIGLIFKKTTLDYQLFNLNEEAFGKRFNYIAILTIIHHLLLFSLANFSFYNLGHVLLQTILSSIFTLILFFLGSYIFRKKQ